MLKFLNALENLPEVVNKFMETIKVLFKKKIINKVIKETLKQIGQSFLSFSDQIKSKGRRIEEITRKGGRNKKFLCRKS